MDNTPRKDVSQYSIALSCWFVGFVDAVFGTQNSDPTRKHARESRENLSRASLHSLLHLSLTLSHILATLSDSLVHP